METSKMMVHDFCQLVRQYGKADRAKEKYELKDQIANIVQVIAPVSDRVIVEGHCIYVYLGGRIDIGRMTDSHREEI